MFLYCICSQYSPSKINYSGMGFQVRIIIFNSILQVIDSEKRRYLPLEFKYMIMSCDFIYGISYHLNI